MDVGRIDTADLFANPSRPLVTGGGEGGGSTGGHGGSGKGMVMMTPLPVLSAAATAAAAAAGTGPIPDASLFTIPSQELRLIAESLSATPSFVLSDMATWIAPPPPTYLPQHQQYQLSPLAPLVFTNNSTFGGQCDGFQWPVLSPMPLMPLMTASTTTTAPLLQFTPRAAPATSAAAAAAAASSIARFGTPVLQPGFVSDLLNDACLFDLRDK